MRPHFCELELSLARVQKVEGLGFHMDYLATSVRAGLSAGIVHFKSKLEVIPNQKKKQTMVQ